MLSTSTSFLIAAVFSMLMLLVLCSLLRSSVSGVKEWSIANCFGILASILYAFGRELPPLIAYELAAASYAAAHSMLLAGFLRFFRREAGQLPLFLGLGPLLVAATIGYFHYVVDSFVFRTVTISVLQIAVCIGILVVVLRAGSRWRSPYPYAFTLTMAVLVIVGSAARAGIYLASTGELTSLLQPSPWNLLFVSAGTLVLPMLTLGGIMMVHDRVVTRAIRAADRDFLTGAWSRRAFFEVAEREISRARRNRTPLSLLLVDVDYFKNINDTYGHATGDQALVELALCSEMVIRAIDYFARIGGDEFALLLPETDAPAALVVAERMRSGYASHEGVAPHTVSIGGDIAQGRHLSRSAATRRRRPVPRQNHGPRCRCRRNARTGNNRCRSPSQLTGREAQRHRACHHHRVCHPATIIRAMIKRLPCPRAVTCRSSRRNPPGS